MNIRNFSIAAIAAGFVASPMIGTAANAPVVLNSCVKAFMADLSSKTPNTLRLRDSRYVGDDSASVGNLSVLGGTSALTLTARDAHDNHPVARAVCTVNSQGTVVDLRAAPVGYDPY